MQVKQNGSETIFYEDYVPTYKNNFFQVKVHSWKQSRPKLTIMPCFQGTGANEHKYYFKAKGEWIKPSGMGEPEAKAFLKSIVGAIDVFTELDTSGNAQAARQADGDNNDNLPF